jgi:hypothetical protein
VRACSSDSILTGDEDAQDLVRRALRRMYKPKLDLVKDRESAGLRKVQEARARLRGH